MRATIACMKQLEYVLVSDIDQKAGPRTYSRKLILF